MTGRAEVVWSDWDGEDGVLLRTVAGVAVSALYVGSMAAIGAVGAGVAVVRWLARGGR